MSRPWKRLLIIGAAGFGREVLWTASEVVADKRDWEIGGFLDDKVDASRESLREKGVSVPVLGAVSDYRPEETDVLVCSVRNPRQRLSLCGELHARGARFTNVLHPTALVHSTVSLGSGVVMRHYSGFGPNCVVGNFVVVNSSCGAGHDAVIEEGCFLGAHSDVMGRAHLERGVFLGSHAVVLPRARVGEFAIVGAGSVVLKRVRPGTTVFGVPARRLDFSPVPAAPGEALR